MVVILRFLEEPALLIEGEERTLVIADLHLGFEQEFLAKGIGIPSQTKKVLSKVKAILSKHKPSRLIFLGDVKHEVAQIPIYEWRELPEFFEELLGLTRVEVVPGNHDGNLEALLPRGVVLHRVEGIMVEGKKRTVYLTHGHAWPSAEALKASFLVMAHQHPTVELKDLAGFKLVERVWMVTGWARRSMARSFLRAQGIDTKKPIADFRRRFGFEVKSPKIIVMPAFNQLLGGWAVNSQEKDEYISPIFRSGSIKLDESSIYLLDGSYLGKLSSLRQAK